MKRTLHWQVVAGVTLAMVVSAAAAANAAPSTGDRSGNTSTVARTSDGRAVTSEAVAKDVAAYWTPERMAAAVDLDFPKGKDATATAGKDNRPDGPAGSIAPVAPSVAGGSGFGTLLNESQTVGKVYFTVPGGGSASCSAATVASGKRRLVVTAGHCVHQGAGGQWYTNWQFVPRYRNGVRPFGTWTAYTLSARTAWINSSSYSEDMAIAVMNTNGAGQRIVDVVGGNGLRWNYGYSVNVTALGYPGNLGGGESQQYCQSGTWYAHDQVIRMWCNMTYGSSGGPWLQEYNDQTGLGYINSTVSHGDNPGNGQFDGPYYDNDIKSLFDYAESISP
ncbi:peptidase [Saccharothrix algeriensis]|uniref:Peptidase n=2 Tax=Catellatospora bangladeshensis TaxID=310355 RepID=A0A8J3JHR8_9ACTN|nr:peptidase [Catellatospora bangladeshensis]